VENIGFLRGSVRQEKLISILLLTNFSVTTIIFCQIVEEVKLFFPNRFYLNRGA